MLYSCIFDSYYCTTQKSIFFSQMSISSLVIYPKYFDLSYYCLRFQNAQLSNVYEVSAAFTNRQVFTYYKEGGNSACDLFLIQRPSTCIKFVILQGNVSIYILFTASTLQPSFILMLPIIIWYFGEFILALELKYFKNLSPSAILDPVRTTALYGTKIWSSPCIFYYYLQVKHIA